MKICWSQLGCVRPDRFAVLFLLFGVVLARCISTGPVYGVAPAELPTVRLGPKPADGVIERRSRQQPTAPDGVKGIPFDGLPLSPLSQRRKTSGATCSSSVPSWKAFTPIPALSPTSGSMRWRLRDTRRV